MPSGLQKTSGKQFEITYEAPWGGVASNKSPLDIADNQLVVGQGVIDIDGVLCQTNVVVDNTKFKWNPHTANAVPCLIFNMTNTAFGAVPTTNLFACDQFGNLYVYDFIGGQFTFQIAAADAPWGVGQRPSAVIVVNGIAYISNYNRNTIYSTNGNGSFVVASNYTGGQFSGVLDDYLLQLNTNSLVDGIKPSRVNWSAPGAFSTWDPAIDRTAGFNTLAVVEDYITGFISLASVGIIITKRGLIQVSPTGIGISPFAFSTLWTSEIGQGCPYPGTIVQYGQNTYLVSDTGVYKVSTNGFTEVSGAARKAILSSIQLSNATLKGLTGFQPAQYTGSILLYPTNSAYPTPYYIFAATTPISTTNPTSTLNVWLLSLETGAWYQQKYSIDALVNATNGTSLSGGIPTNIDISSITLEQTNEQTGTSLPVIVLYGTANYAFVPKPFITTLYTTSDINPVLDENTVTPLALTFKAHEIKIWRKPTFRRVLVKAFGSGTFTISVNGKSFGNIVLDGTTTVRTYLTSKGEYTGESPQLTITSSNFKGAIVKVMIPGTFADGDVD